MERLGKRLMDEQQPIYAICIMTVANTESRNTDMVAKNRCLFLT